MVGVEATMWDAREHIFGASMGETLDLSFTREIGGEDLLPLFRQTYWAPKRSAGQIEGMLHNSPIVLGAWRGRRLIGFARALTDDVYRAVIDDIVVDEPFRGKGVGTAMVKALLERLKHVEEIFLGCDVKEVPFYEKLGFHRAKNPYMKLRPG